MKTTTALKISATAAIAALILTGCGSRPTDQGPAASSDFSACMITSTGGIDDKSFNASAWAGLQKTKEDGIAEVSYVQSKTEADYATNLSNLASGSCNLVVTVGGLMAEATQNAAKQNPDQRYLQIDEEGNGSNLQGMEFEGGQAGFLGGYLAASQSKTGIVATYGGINIVPVTALMDGFWEGVQYYNAAKGTSVKVLGWDQPSQNGVFGGGFSDQTKGQQIGSNFLSQGADVIFPVAGNLGIGTASVVQKAANGSTVLWVDTDGCVSAEQYCDVFLSSAVKNIDKAVETIVAAGAKGDWSSEDYVGTLENNGVGLAEFHEFDSVISDETKAELTQLTADIIDGTVKLASPSASSEG